MTERPRRLAAGLVALAAAVPLLLSACGGSSGSSGSSGVTLRMVWWGSDDRASQTTAAVKLFENAHPNVTVKLESLPFDGYYDRLSTQVAANTAPDVQQMTSDYVTEYGARGALLTLSKVGVSKLDPATTKGANIGGKQLGVPTGIATEAIVANPKLFAAAGVAMPDDKTWTWASYEALAVKISKASPKGVFGTEALGDDAGQLAVWARQNGADQWTADGGVGMTQDIVTKYFTFVKQQMSDGAAPSAAASTEQIGQIEQSGTALNKYAMGFWNTSQLTPLEATSKDGLKLLRLPTTSGVSGDAKMAFGASQYWAASSRTKHPVEAQELIDYLVNSTDAGKVLLVGRGSPANSEVRAAVTPLLSADDAQIINFVSAVEPETVEANPDPKGTSSFQDVMRRYTAEVRFGRMAPDAAAAGLLKETAALIQK
jgi:multiple sugar transport system substrate-binding protein